jgi:hypothetical protein
MSFDASPTVAGSGHSRFLPRRTASINCVLVSAVIAGSWGPCTPNGTLTGVLQQVDTSGQNYYVNAHPYIEEPLEHLVKRIPELRRVQPAPDQQELSKVLAKTGAKVEDFFRDIVDLHAYEEITQEN